MRAPEATAALLLWWGGSVFLLDGALTCVAGPSIGLRSAVLLDMHVAKSRSKRVGVKQSVDGMAKHAVLAGLVRTGGRCLQGVEVADDVDYHVLAHRAGGYSGDDLTGVCRDAALNGMRRRIAGLAPDQIRCSHSPAFSMMSQVAHSAWKTIMMFGLPTLTEVPAFTVHAPALLQRGA